MTTIAASIEHRCMAADMLATAGGQTVVSRRAIKINRINGCCVGTAGLTSDAMEFAQWFVKHDMDDRPKVRDDFCAIVLSHKGLFRYFEECVPIAEPDVTYYAIGSGWEWALAAMDFGRSPAQAVRYAMTRDVSTGSRVAVRRL